MSRAVSSLRRLSIEQGGRCFFCKEQVAPALETVDHVMPLREGHQWRHFRNEVMACVTCNQSKGHRLPTDVELRRLMVLKKPYADADYMVSAVTAESRTDWLAI